MLNRFLLCILSGLIVALVPWVPNDATACAPPRCLGGWFFPDEGTIPANLDLVLWGPIHGWTFEPAAVGSADVQMVKDPEGTQEPVPFDLEYDVSRGWFTLELLAALEQGETYRLQGTNFCDPETGLPNLAEFTVSEEADLPTSLGLVLSEHAGIQSVSVSTASGSCAAPVTADTVRVTLELAQSAQPWEDAFLYTTLVDGEPWHPSHFLPRPVPIGESWEGRGEDLLYAICLSDDPYAQPGLAEGTHTVRFRAEIPGVDGVWQTEAIEVSLSCVAEEEELEQADEPDPDGGADPPPEPVPDAGTDIATDAVGDDPDLADFDAAPEDSALADGDEPSESDQGGADAEGDSTPSDLLSDGAVIEGDPQAEAEPAGEDGCSCRATTGTAAPRLLLLGGLLACFLHRRKR